MSVNTPQNESDFTPASYKVRINGAIDSVPNPEPTAREILEHIGKDPTLFALVLKSPSGEERILPLDEETDLRRPGIEEFTFHSTQRVFHIYVDEMPLDFDKHDPTGEEILGLVSKHPSRYALTQIIVGVEDQFIDASEKVDLRTSGIEKFTSVPWDEVKKDITIIVNGQQKIVQGPKLSYQQVINLAYDNSPPVGAGVRITVNYSHGHHDQPQGSLVAGASVKVKEGMIFDVTATNQS